MNMYRPPSERDLIDAFIATRGVTRCPTVFLAPSFQSDVRPPDVVLRRHSEALREAECAKHTRRGRPTGNLNNLTAIMTRVLRIVTEAPQPVLASEIGRVVGMTSASVRLAIAGLRRRGARIETVYLKDKKKGFRLWQ